MKTLKELSEEIGEIMIWHIIHSKIKDPGAIRILLEQVYRDSKIFVKKTLRVR